jgi:hypothetical protein
VRGGIAVTFCSNLKSITYNTIRLPRANFKPTRACDSTRTRVKCIATSSEIGSRNGYSLVEQGYYFVEQPNLIRSFGLIDQSNSICFALSPQNARANFSFGNQRVERLSP